jgi:flagellar FliL protein
VIGQLAVFLFLTLAAIGMGFGTARFIAPVQAPSDKTGDAPQIAAGNSDGSGHRDASGHDADAEGKEAVSSLPNVVMLPSITTNMAAPDETWVRMELAIIFDGPPEPVLTEAIHQDLLAFMRTVKLHQMDGASGLIHLRADLEDRVRIRSEGKVTGVLIRTLLFE